MSFTTRQKASVFLFTLVLLMQATQLTLAVPQRTFPNPVLIFTGAEYYEQGGKQWTRYKLSVFNYDAYPNTLFAPAPSLPPCGKNNNAARTWVEILDQSGKRLYGFCAVQSNSDLTKLWFALETDVLPPSWVYVVLNDRQTGTSYKSNLTETVE
jgi:hypothetical protein